MDYVTELPFQGSAIGTYVTQKTERDCLVVNANMKMKHSKENENDRERLLCINGWGRPLIR